MHDIIDWNATEHLMNKSKSHSKLGINKQEPTMRPTALKSEQAHLQG